MLTVPPRGEGKIGAQECENMASWLWELLWILFFRSSSSTSKAHCGTNSIMDLIALNTASSLFSTVCRWEMKFYPRLTATARVAFPIWSPSLRYERWQNEILLKEYCERTKTQFPSWIRSEAGRSLPKNDDSTPHQPAIESCLHTCVLCATFHVGAAATGWKQKLIWLDFVCFFCLVKKKTWKVCVRYLRRH